MDIEIFPPGTHSQYSRKKYHENREVNEVVDLLFETKNIFLKDIAFILTSCANAGGLKQFSRPVLKRWQLTLPKPMLISLIKILSNLYAIYNDSEKTNLKGAIVEVYMYKCMVTKYTSHDPVYFESNVKVDGWISSKEVDVAALKNGSSNGECYECKLGTGALNTLCLKDQLKNLKNIYFKSMGQIITVIASFESKQTIEFKVTDCSDYFQELLLYGRDELT